MTGDTCAVCEGIHATLRARDLRQPRQERIFQQQERSARTFPAVGQTSYPLGEAKEFLSCRVLPAEHMVAASDLPARSREAGHNRQ